MSASEIENIIAGLSKNNLLRLFNEGVFRSDETRKTFFKKNFNYVPPKQIYLGKMQKEMTAFFSMFQ